ncbi:hypothetical protein L6R52_44025 [Myxococcota bacterium]|nr:hypothetical protein [Myxococcota bacterium]
MIALVLALLAVAPSEAPSFERFVPGQTEADVRARLRGVGGVRWLSRADDHALADGLVATKLLETMNAAGLTPVSSSSGGALELAWAESLVLFELDGASWAVALGPSARGARVVTAVLARVPVPPEGPPYYAGRLARSKRALAALRRAGWSLRPAVTDRWGNVRRWIGDGPPGLLSVERVAEDDELRVLVVLRR